MGKPMGGGAMTTNPGQVQGSMNPQQPPPPGINAQSNLKRGPMGIPGYTPSSGTPPIIPQRPPTPPGPSPQSGVFRFPPPPVQPTPMTGGGGIPPAVGPPGAAQPFENPAP